jgi:hypothetical protein
MLTDKQCDEFRRLPMSLNNMMREIFKAGFRAGDASQDGALGDALRTLETAVRADKIGSVSVVSRYDSKGAWLRDEFRTTNAALDRLDALRNAATPNAE